MSERRDERRTECGIESVHCHAIKNKTKTIQWIKSRNCDIIDNNLR